MDNDIRDKRTNSFHDSLDKVALVERNIMPQGVLLVDAAAVTKSSRQDLIMLAAEIQKADNYTEANLCNKLKVIADQIRFLQKQAKDILLEAERDSKLHHIACNFVKQPGHMYHLYQRESGQFYFSMLSPEEWGESVPSQCYKGSFRLEHDRSWTPLSQLQSKDNELHVLKKLLPSESINTLLKSVTFDTT